MADELINAIFTAAPVLAGIRLALVYIAETPRIVVTTGALTPETVDQVYAHSTVGAGVRVALVDVLLAVLTGEAGNTLAGVPEITRFVCR